MDPLTMAALGMGIYQIGQSAFQSKQAKQMAAKNIFVPRRTAQGVTDNLALAESRASEGLSDAAKQVYVTNADRGLSASIDAVLRSGAGNNMLGELNDNYNQGISRLALAEDEARIRSLDTFMKANYANAQEDNTNWEVNDYAQWANKAQAATLLKQQSAANFSGGVNTAMGAIAASQQGKVNPTAGVPATTKMVATTPQKINYSAKTLAHLNALGVRPISTASPYVDNNFTINGANNYNIDVPNLSSLTPNWTF